VEYLIKGLPAGNVSRELRLYMFCSPTMDGVMRCLPRAGGYYDQYYSDILRFKIIEHRIAEIQKRDSPKGVK